MVKVHLSTEYLNHNKNPQFERLKGILISEMLNHYPITSIKDYQVIT